MEPILQVSHLSVSLPGKNGPAPILKDISFSLKQGEILGLVGESGSGKSMTAFAVNQLLPGGGKSITGGSVLFAGEELTGKTEKQMQTFRGKDIAMIFQEPMTCLNPVFTVKRQMTDVIMIHEKRSRKEAEIQAADMLKKVHIRDPERTLSCYPYELSGGMRQRVMIAIALSCSPRLLIADEPTTALDVTVQAQIIFLLQEACQESGTGIIFISHDLGVVSQLCSRIAVMYAGTMAETGPASEVLKAPGHPYTKALLAAVPRFTSGGVRDRLYAISGMVPDPSEIQRGCLFAPRCPHAMDICRTEHPPIQNLGNQHQVSCFLEKGVSRGDGIS
jgi:oligopeptide/dipeptide ABC transporter ATP-binding protein